MQQKKLFENRIYFFFLSIFKLRKHIFALVNFAACRARTRTQEKNRRRKEELKKIQILLDSRAAATAASVFVCRE